MYLLLSPSKTIDVSEKRKNLNAGIPYFVNEAEKLAGILKRLDIYELESLMSISPKLAQLTYDRYQFWNPNHLESNSCQSIFAFRGDVFTGIDAFSMNNNDLAFLNEHLIILSGLYGMLRPYDFIQPYRLEVAHKLNIKGVGNLYDFWRERVTQAMNNIVGSKVLINLASNEYFKMLNINAMEAEIITPVFKDFKNGAYKVVSIYAKRARGLMTRFIVENMLSNAEEIKMFDCEGYFYNKKLSGERDFIFTRG